MDGIRKMVCDQCGRVWDALCYESSERLECPGCGYMVQVPPQKIKESAGTDTQQANANISEDGRIAGDSEPCVICGGRMVQYGESLECEKCGHKDLLLL